MVLAGLALAGCSDPADEPQALPAVSAEPSAEPSVAPLPTPSLTGAKAGVEQAVLAYFAGVNRAAATGDLTAFEAAHGPECTACTTFSDLIRSTTAKGQRFEGATDVVESYTIPDFQGPNAVVDVRFRVAPYRIVAADGTVVSTSQGSSRRSLIVMNQVGGRWIVGEVNQT